MLVPKAWASALVAFGVAALGAQSESQAEAPAPASAAKTSPSTPASSSSSGSVTATAKPEPPPRTPLPPETPSVPLPSQQHLEIGPVLGLVTRIAHVDGAGRPTPARLAPGVGWGGTLSVQAFRHLRITTYIVGANHALVLPRGSLGLAESITSGDVHTFTLGLRLSPSIAIGSRVSAWVTGGIGWGRLQYPRMTATADSGASFTIHDRGESMVEVPFGLGASVVVIPRWLNLNLELMGSLLPGQDGAGAEDVQAIDAAGRKRNVGSMPHLDASFTQLIGVSLLL